tara:strand:- start:7315 stop:7494 length:180 start_codon:yes stop_codon:yes gene_type:complete
MKVRVLPGRAIVTDDPVPHGPGSIVDLSAVDAKRKIASGCAEAVAPPKPKAKPTPKVSE